MCKLFLFVIYNGENFKIKELKVLDESQKC